jgi:O-antigen biosynthesis protein
MRQEDTMSIDQQTNPYDETYYRVGCGVPYERNEHWLTFFGKIADAIVREINPGSVLDAGCAMGFLVEALRQRGIEAYGVDISDYAIAQVADEIKPYCWVGSVTERLPRRYDLVVCIETLEHLRPDDVPAAIQQLCAAADDILFSSTPDDRTEPTHFSVQPPEAWASLFAAQGFWHDVEFDASFVTPWAMRFRRTGDPAHRALIPLERALWSLRRENTALRDLASSLRATPAEPSHDDLQRRIAQLEDALSAQQTQTEQSDDYWRLLTQAFSAVNTASHADELRKEVITLSIENQRLRTELKATSTQLSHLLFQQATLQSRAAYKVFTRTVRSIDTLLPEGSVRSRAFRKVSRTLKRQHVTAEQVQRVTGARMDAIEAPVTPGPVLAAQAVTCMPYTQWARETTPSRVELAMSKRQVAQWTYQPVISLMTPVFDPPVEMLRNTIESVLGQIYERWELCLVDGGSKNPAIRDLLKLYAKRDPRIKLKLLDQNLGISGNTNEAARLATGEFVQIFDHDDLLEPHTLFEVVKALQADPTLDVIYFDEDKVSADGGQREEPFFKPDWSPAMLLSANYLTHCVIRRSLYEEVGGCDSAMDGAQDWDLLLKVTERSQRICHIPHILYHWRKAPASAAGGLAAKPYVFERQATSVTNSLRRCGYAQAQAAFTDEGQMRVTWPIMEERVSIIIPTKDKAHLLERCIETLLRRTTYRDYEIILVDTGSVEQRTLAYYKTLKANPQLANRFKIVEYNGVFNYSHANNVGAQHASGSLLLFLNNDTEIIEPGWLEEMARWAQRPEIGVVGAKLLFPSGHIQHAGVVMGIGGHAGHIFAGLDVHTMTMFGSTDWYRDYMAVTGACMMTRRAVFDEIGGFDEEYLIAFSDVEYCLRARDHGYTSVYTPYACLKHHESASRGSGIPLRDIQRGYEHMYPIVDRGDPYFNANLATAVSVPTLAVNDAPERAERLRRVVREWEFYFKE